ncbi:xanthine dehydrogenase family protein molybdopterin-binding subunit [Ensifer aridi]|uniref:xanthine dehydrogenase family protein molybdopterin-binding subunit n=1 Tax=Ensifer aridi TaxID=1708715 RepID=UPI00041CED5B|nr:xanthine dehydrogenase family protein molybdopterin-binding subunit [Ensifer aridi]
MSVGPFSDRARVDALAKVRGEARFAADLTLPRLLYAMTVPSAIAKGTMTALPVEAALRVPGVVRVLTPDDFPAPPPFTEDGPPPPPPTLETTITYRGQPLALVIAETLEAAIEGAETIRPTFASEPFACVMESAGAQRQPAEDVAFGDVPTALSFAASTVEAIYDSPTQHHNPLELIATVAVWEDGKLLIHESTQASSLVKGAVAGALRIDPARVHVRGATIGGSFGQKAVQRQTALVARAAILSGRPVKLVQPRGQIFHTATYRTRTRHRIQIGADAAGKIVAVQHHVEQEQSPGGYFAVSEYHRDVIRMYGVQNYLGTGADIRLDRQDPGYMRGTHPQPACFAFESALDELAYKSGRDPVELRLANDTRVDPQNGQPLSSRFLNECLREGARRFGWSRRSPEPGSITAPDGSQIGWGMACGIYQSATTPAIATLRIDARGRTRFAISGHEMGQGMHTAIAAVLLEGLDIDPDGLEVAIGDTRFAPQHMTAGSWGTNSVVPAAMQAAERMRSAFAELLGGRQVSGNLHRKLAAIRRPFLQIEVSTLGPGQDQSALEALRQGGFAVAESVYPGFSTFSYSAHFVEVRIEPGTRRIRVPRVVSIADCGRVVSPRTAESQVYGGVIWGLSHALREATEIDPRYGGYLNVDLADYVVPVNADIGEIEIGLVDQPDPLANAVGVKGLGQVSMVGISAAVANAVFHATGKRVRELPIRVEHLL